MGRKLVMAFFLAVVAVPLMAAPAQALDLFPNFDVIPDPNLEDLNDIPDLGPAHGGGKYRGDGDGDGIPDRRDLNPYVFGGAEDDKRFHRRNRDDDDDADDDQYMDASQYDSRTGSTDEAAPTTPGLNEEQERVDSPPTAERREKKVNTEPASSEEDGGWLGTAFGVLVVLWIAGALFGR